MLPWRVSTRFNISSSCIQDVTDCLCTCAGPGPADRPGSCGPDCNLIKRTSCCADLQIPMFKGYVQSPNDFFQMPFMSAIAREISRHYLQAAGRIAEAANLDWQPQLAPFPHPQQSPGSAGYILPPFIFVACMFATISFLSVVVSEKESGLRQALQTMGLQQGSYWVSWWLFEALMAAITAWILIAFGKQQCAEQASSCFCMIGCR